MKYGFILKSETVFIIDPEEFMIEGEDAEYAEKLILQLFSFIEFSQENEYLNFSRVS